MKMIEWARHRRIVLNLQVGRRYLQVYLWGARVLFVPYATPRIQLVALLWLYRR